MYYVAITGHRPHKLDNEYSGVGPISRAIRLRIISIIQLIQVAEPDITFITGMALGIDQLFAEIAIELNMPFIAAIPCLNQSKIWPPTSVERYNRILSNKLCTKYLVYNGPYNNACMQERNIWMVDKCNELLGVHNGSSGGTKNCLVYAESKKKKTTIIDPNTLHLCTP